MGCNCKLQQTHCCCCSLRLGTIISGIFICISTSAFMFGFLPVTHFLFTTGYEEFPKDVKQFETVWAQIDSISFIPRIGYCLAHLLVFIFLIIGVQTKNKLFFLPWLIFMGMNCTIITLGTLSLIGVMIFLIVNYVAKLLMVIIFFVSVLITALWWYIFLCVWSYYIDLQDEKLIKITDAEATTEERQTEV